MSPQLGRPSWPNSCQTSTGRSWRPGALPFSCAPPVNRRLGQCSGVSLEPWTLTNAGALSMILWMRAVSIFPVGCSLLSLASVGCLLLMLTVRGASDWSGSLAVTFYGLVIIAVGLALVGGLVALLGSMFTGERVFCLGVGLAVPALFAYYTVSFLNFVSHTR